MTPLDPAVGTRRAGDHGQPSITCPSCGMTSYNPNDIAEQYCGNCHRWHKDMSP